MTEKSTEPATCSFVKIAGDAPPVPMHHIHDGQGEVLARQYKFGANAPAKFVRYTLKPGASEGVHTHTLDDPNEPPFEEFYFIISGNGWMDIGSSRVNVKAGDHVFVPLNVPHGIQAAEDSELDLLLTYIEKKPPS